MFYFVSGQSLGGVEKNGRKFSKVITQLQQTSAYMMTFHDSLAFMDAYETPRSVCRVQDHLIWSPNERDMKEEVRMQRLK